MQNLAKNDETIKTLNLVQAYYIANINYCRVEQLSKINKKLLKSYKFASVL